MSTCDDPKCPLNRQGIYHEPHHIIENTPVTNPCDDSRCAMNRMGIRHNLHEGQYGSQQKTSQKTSQKKDQKKDQKTSQKKDQKKDQKTSQTAGQKTKKETSQSYFDDDTFEGIPYDILDEAARILRDSHNRFGSIPGNDYGSVPKGRRRQQQQTTPPKRPAEQLLTEAERILRAKTPHEIFGISKNATCHEIKTRYRELAKKYDASKGIIHKSAPEKKRSNRIMAKINDSFSYLKEEHGC